MRFGASFGRAGWPALGLGLALALGACTKDVQVHGNIPDPEQIAAIEPGLATRQEVLQILGSPSTISTFLDRRWYYIGEKTTQFAFMTPDVLERSVLVVAFDEGGTVERTQAYTLEDGRVVDPVTRQTPTEGRDFTILQQLFGNIGRFPVGLEQ